MEIAARRCDNGVDDLPWVVRKLQGSPTLGELKLPGQESRESSVEASLALSYGDLDPDLQQRFRALGVFAPAPFDLSALAAVWGSHVGGKPLQQFLRRMKAVLTTSQSSTNQPDLADAVRQLVRRGLLSVDNSSTADHPVYRQHTLLRAYAGALLEQADELKSTVARHVAYYRALPGREAENWQVAEAFWDQIEMGWQHAWRAGPRTALSYYYALRAFLTIRSRYAAHSEWASTLLRLPAAQLPNKARAPTLNNIGRVYDDLGDKPQALAYYKQALSLGRQVGDRAGEATALTNIGAMYDDLGEKQQALAYYEQALLLSRQVGDRGSEAITLTNIGLVYAALGEKQQALAYYKQALPLFRQVSDRSGEAATLSGMASVYRDMEQPTQALLLYEKALALRRAVEDRYEEALTLAGMGILAHTINPPAAGFRLILLGATLLAERGIAAPTWLSEALETHTQQLGYDEAQLEVLRTEVMAGYANDRGDSLIREAFPEDAT